MDEKGDFLFGDEQRLFTVIWGGLWTPVLGFLCGAIVYNLIVPEGRSRLPLAALLAVCLVPFFFAFRSVFRRAWVRLDSRQRTVEKITSWFGSPRVTDSYRFDQVRRVVAVTRERMDRNRRGVVFRSTYESFEVSLVLQDGTELELCDSSDRVGVTEMMTALGELLHAEVAPPKEG